jgi:YidC/Oxa1 family membrane protein insertase
MDQRLFLAIGLSMLVLIGYYFVFPPPPPKRPPAPAPAAENGTPAAAATSPAAAAPAAPTAATASAPAPQLSAGAPAAPEASTQVALGRRITVDTPRYKAVFDTRGGRMISFRLKDYRVGKENIDWGDVLPFLRTYLHKPVVDGNALEDMAPTPLIGNEAFGVRFVGEDSLSRTFQQAVYLSEQESLRVTGNAREPARLVLRARDERGLTLEKTFTFHPDSYVVEYRLTLLNYGEGQRTLRVASLFGEGPQGARQPAEFRGHVGPIWREDGDIDTEDPDDVASTLVVRQPQWMGITDIYFLTAARAETPISHGFFTSQEVPLGEKTHWIPAYGMELPQVDLQPDKMIASDFRLYLGPKNVDEMQKFGNGLEESLDLTLDLLAQPMLALMRWFHSFTGNYGVAIILLTIVVRVLLFPLTYRGMLNIKRMQKLQPRMVALREKFKGDKERLNKEMMAMYKKHKMNPLGGCLPIALQIPIFFALYSALLGAIELRHEPFMLWITDLSAQDGLYVSPLLMGASMLLQQKLTPASVDPTQAKIMMWMPVIFTFFMLSFPAGLVLYWFTSNTLSIVQQVLINRINVPEPED